METDFSLDDPILDELQKEMDNPPQTERELAALIGGAKIWEIGGKSFPVPPLPVGTIAHLTLCRSPLLRQDAPADRADVLAAALVVIRGRDLLACDPAAVRRHAAAYFGDTAIDTDELRADVRQLIVEAFEPYLRIPVKGGGEKKDDDRGLAITSSWLAAFVWRVHQAVGLSPDTIIWKLPMAAAALYDLECRRQLLHHSVPEAPPPDPAIGKAYWERAEQLMKEKGGKL